MACLPSELYTKYTNDLARVQDQISRLEASIAEAFDNAEVEEYSFNSTEGQQKTKRRDTDKMLKTLRTLENRERWLINKLGGRSLMNVNLRRKRYNCYGNR